MVLGACQILLLPEQTGKDAQLVCWPLVSPITARLNIELRGVMRQQNEHPPVSLAAVAEQTAANTLAICIYDPAVSPHVCTCGASAQSDVEASLIGLCGYFLAALDCYRLVQAWRLADVWR